MFQVIADGDPNTLLITSCATFKGFPRMLYIDWILYQDPKCMTLHLPILKYTFHFLDHWMILSRFFAWFYHQPRKWIKWKPFTLFYLLSANFNRMDFGSVSKSLIYMIKRTGRCVTLATLSSHVGCRICWRPVIDQHSDNSLHRRSPKLFPLDDTWPTNIPVIPPTVSCQNFPVVDPWATPFTSLFPSMSHHFFLHIFPLLSFPFPFFSSPFGLLEVSRGRLRTSRKKDFTYTISASLSYIIKKKIKI